MVKRNKHYYVVVDDKVVYKLDNATKLAYWANPTAMPRGEKPLAFTKKAADNLCESLILNFHNAHVEIYWWEMPYQETSEVKRC